MSIFRVFNIASDGSYDPNSMPNIYLSSLQVATAAENVVCKDIINLDALELIIELETLQRAKCKGQISPTEKSSKARALHQDFQRKHGCWAYTTKSYKDFYQNICKIKE